MSIWSSLFDTPNMRISALQSASVFDLTQARTMTFSDRAVVVTPEYLVNVLSADVSCLIFEVVKERKLSVLPMKHIVALEIRDKAHRNMFRLHTAVVTVKRHPTHETSAAEVVLGISWNNNHKYRQSGLIKAEGPPNTKRLHHPYKAMLDWRIAGQVRRRLATLRDTEYTLIRKVTLFYRP